MQTKSLINDRIRNLVSYKVQEVSEGEIKLDAQENPYPLDDLVKEKIFIMLRNVSLNRYPDPDCRILRKLIAGYSGVSPSNILLGNGSDELILSLLLACGGQDRVMAIPVPTFSMYDVLARATGTKTIKIPLDKDFQIPVNKILAINADIVFIAYPNNPTGNCFSKQKLNKLIKYFNGLIVIDEAYFEFSGKSLINKIYDYNNIVILRTFSKAFSLAGIRAGYMISDKTFIKHIRKVQMPYNLSIINQKILEIAIQECKVLLRTSKRLNKSKKYLFNELKKIKGITVFPSEANFILMKVANIKKTVNALKKNKINVREFLSDDLKDHLRVTIGTYDENESFLKVIKKVYNRR